MNDFFKSVFGAKLGRTRAQRNLTAAQPVYFFADVTGDALIESSATLSNIGTPDNSSLRRKLHSHDLSSS